MTTIVVSTVSQIERRADRLADLAQGADLLQSAAELARARLDLLLEARVRLLELRGRPVELVAERLQLVTGPDLDAVTQIPRADPRRPRLQCPDRRDHAPGQEHARQNREHEAENEEDGAADDRGLKGRERLAERLLDEHEPPERSRSGRTR